MDLKKGIDDGCHEALIKDLEYTDYIAVYEDRSILVDVEDLMVSEDRLSEIQQLIQAGLVEKVESKQMKNKIIIHNYTDLSDLEVLDYIIRVVANGFLSETNKNGKQYCFITTFETGYAVSCDKRGNTHTFKIIKD